jgi:hypothetical protein
MLPVALTIHHWMIEWLANNELERMWKEVASTYFEVLFLQFPADWREQKKSLSQDSWCPGLDLNQATHKYSMEFQKEQYAAGWMKKINCIHFQL